MAVEMMNNGILSLDFWQDTVNLSGTELPNRDAGL